MILNPKPANFRDAIAESIAANLKSYDVADFCVTRLSLVAQGPDEDPFRSKAVYVRSKLQGLSLSRLESIARTLLEEWDDPGLEQLIARTGLRGVQGEMKNLIFAADGPKPEIVLRDAINNVIEITRNADKCLVFDSPLGEEGLSWGRLVEWWGRKSGEQERDTAAASLWKRLNGSLANVAEKRLFRCYTRLYGIRGGFDYPALIPQVYLHYDPYVHRLSQSRGPLNRQRMDFLLLLPHRVRVVLEIDGKQHYSAMDGLADAQRYAEMVAEDRELRLRGYEVYRFGGRELMSETAASDLLGAFFDDLFERYGVDES